MIGVGLNLTASHVESLGEDFGIGNWAAGANGADRTCWCTTTFGTDTGLKFGTCVGVGTVEERSHGKLTTARPLPGYGACIGGRDITVGAETASGDFGRNLAVTALHWII